ncbi:hypothetical protein MTO96_002001 [Rhipicephalus appendiculatus]
MDGSETRQIMFKGPPKRVFIDDMEPVSLPFDGTAHEFVSKRTGKKRTIKFGAPLREIFLDGVPYSAQFDNSPIAIKTADGEVHVIRLEPQPPTVDIEKRPPEHVLRALNLHPEKLADTDSDLRTLPPESRPQQPPEGGFQQNKESGGWVRYGSAAEERAALNSNWQQQPPLGQPQQDPNIRPPWPPGPPRAPQGLENGTTTLGMISWRVVACQEWAQVEGAINSQALVARSTPLTSGKTFLNLRCVLITSALEKFGQASCSHSSRHAGHLLLPGIQGFLRWARLDLVDPPPPPSGPSGVIKLSSSSSTCTALHGGCQAAPSGA